MTKKICFTGSVIATQLLDVSIRVQAVRGFAVAEMSTLLDSFPVAVSAGGSTSMFEVLYAAAWIIGEFASELIEPERSLGILLKPRALPGHIQGVYVQNIVKLFTRVVTDQLERRDVAGILKVFCFRFCFCFFLYVYIFSYVIFCYANYHISLVPVISRYRSVPVPGSSLSKCCATNLTHPREKLHPPHPMRIS